MLTTIQDMIDRWLYIEQENRSTRVRSGKWSPSSFGRCYRYQYWNRKIEPVTNPPDARTLRVFKAGQLFHDFAQSFVPEGQREVKASNDEAGDKAGDIVGYADYVTEDCVYDFKSQHSRAFFHMAKSDKDISEEKEANILQVMTYAWLLGKDKGRLVYISKDDLCINEYEFMLTDWISKIKYELLILRNYWSLGELPPPGPRAYGGKEGKYCSFADKCFELGWDCVKCRKVEEI